ncbi:MAG: endonuclease family protein [Parcubacteria group bacterium]|nr:endonuclease family protein [Parcubacteria group bacterium]
MQKKTRATSIRAFQKIVRDFYAENGRRHLPWRKTRNPYNILVSEVMLQQTQADRVIPKYVAFMKKFPTVKALASSENKDLLKEWQGLGYNRRALNLKRAAESILTNHKGRFPKTHEDLVELPGVGPATAGDIMAFAYNKPAIVIETNIRTVFIHHYFLGKEKVSDKQIIELVEATLPENEIQDWYYALMDYGTYLKKTLGNNIHRSAHYKKQSPFKGSNRELRSQILKLILEKPRTKAELLKLFDSSVEKNLIALEKEGLIRKKGGKFIS